MPKMKIRLGFALLLVAALSACGSTTLIELNNDFARLSEQAADAQRRLDAGTLNNMELDTLLEVNRLSFAANGDRAADAAEEADTPRGKASFLNLAVRSYLNSGAVADTRIPDLADQGIELCNGSELLGLNVLPVTCGYFHVVNAQAISNEAERIVAELSRKARLNRVPGGPPTLSAEDGKMLRRAFEQFLEQASAINGAKALIDLTSADPRFEVALERQKVILFCNAFETLAPFGDVVTTGPDWDRETTRAMSRDELNQAQNALGIASRSAACG